MNKYLLISVRPEHVSNILNGDKTIELRKVVLNWVKEDLKQGGTVKVLLYCTKSKPYLMYEIEDYDDGDFAKSYYGYSLFTKKELLDLDIKETPLNGKVVAEFDLNKIEKVDICKVETYKEIKKRSMVDVHFILEYAKSKDIYALYIDNLNIFSEPKELSDFKTKVNNKNGNVEAPFYVRVDKAPQNMMTVWGK